MHYWWRGVYLRANHIIGVLHQDMNLIKLERKVELNCDKLNSPCFARLMNFCTLVAVRYYATAGDTHKARQVSRVGLFSKLSHLIRAAYDNGGAGSLNLIDEGCAEALYQYMRKPGGGHTFKSLVSEVFDVNIPRDIVHAAQSRGGELHHVYLEARKKLIFMGEATHMTEYTPAMLFDTIRFKCLYSPEMRQWHAKWFVYQTKRQHKDGSPHQGYDNGMEVGVKDFKASLSGISDKVRSH